MTESRNTFRTLQVTALSLCLAGISGCATRADLLQVKQDQREARALLADQQVAIDGLRRRVEILRGEVGDGGRGAGGRAASDVLQRFNDVERRLSALELGRGGVGGEMGEPPVVGLPGDVSPSVDVPPPPVLKAQSPFELALAKDEAAVQGSPADSDYREALNLLRQGNCGQAVPKLRDFIRKNPRSDMGDNAQYWIGHCYYGQRDFNRAIIELNEVLLKYSKGDRVPAALLLLADAFADSGDKIDARLILQKLVSDHPRSEEAERGRQKLQAPGQ